MSGRAWLIAPMLLRWLYSTDSSIAKQLKHSDTCRNRRKLKDIITQCTIKEMLTMYAHQFIQMRQDYDG